MAHEKNQDISNRRNITRFFVEHPHISWMMLVAVLVWGWFGYTSMPQRKDPEIPVRVAVAACPWPGATAEQVEQSEPLHLFWYPAPPEDGSLARLLFGRSAACGAGMP